MRDPQRQPYPDRFQTGTVEADTLTDATDGGSWETLRTVGYEEGDFFPIQTFSTRTDQTFNTANTTYTDAYQVNEFIITADDYPGTMSYRANYRVQPQGGVIFTRLYNDTDAEGVPNSELSVTGSSWTNVSTGVQSYTPPTTGSPIAINPQIYSGDGTQVDIAIAQVEVGSTI